jgi:hypothetical protein
MCPQGGQVGAAGDQVHVGSGLGQPTAEVAAHAAGPIDGHAHRRHLPVQPPRPSMTAHCRGYSDPLHAIFGDKIPKDFSALTDLWENEQGVMGASSKRLIVFAPDGPGWTDISGVWENVVHHPSKAGDGLSEVDYGTIIDSIANSV